jgi:hypothetical protein
LTADETFFASLRSFFRFTSARSLTTSPDGDGKKAAGGVMVGRLRTAKKKYLNR